MPVATRQEIDQYARDLSNEKQRSVYLASKIKTEKRVDVLRKEFKDADALRELAGQIRQHSIEHLDQYLEQAEASLTRNGAKVHFAHDAEEANRLVFEVMRTHGCQTMVKSKSMVSEETELVPYLEKMGMEAVETDLGEFIVQIDGDHPSHIVTPIIHKNRDEIARSFEKHGLGDFNNDPATITARARQHLREKYLKADCGLTGANFVVAESGRIVLVTNEGNARFCMAAPRVHIAMIGIEKVIPRDRDLAPMLGLLGRSATGQPLTVYTQFIGGPRREGLPDGPEAMHVIFIDNKRSEILAGDCREILRCIRCGACLNVCPVYRQSSGHAYRSVYPGPVGAILSPLLKGSEFVDYADLPKASSLCGACNDVCPVKIPLTDLLLKLRDRGKREHASKASAGTPGFGLWATAASSPALWKTGLKFGHMMNVVPHAMLDANPAARSWRSSRDLPPFRGGAFRHWMKERQKSKGKPSTPPSNGNHPA